MYIIGRFIGFLLFAALIQPMRFVYGRRKCSYENTVNLDAAHNRTFIAVSNHIKPRSRFLKFISMPYDAFLIRKMFLQYGIYATAFTSYDAPAPPRSAFDGFFRKYFKEPLTKGIVRSMDLIPLNRRKQDPKTTAEVRRRLRERPTALGVFPEGTWFRGYRAGRKLYGGAAVYSKRYDLPILPVYAHAYNMKGDIDIRVGELIEGVNDATTLMERIREQFNALKNREPMPGRNRPGARDIADNYRAGHAAAAGPSAPSR